jgi:hypothetical protein
MPWVKSNLGYLALALALHAQTAAAQGDLLGTDEMAEAIVAMTSRVWTGPRTPSPGPTKRPTGTATTLRSSRGLVAVHADASVEDAVLQGALRALELARSRLDVRGWPDTMSDGELGGGAELDLYLSGALPPGAYVDGLIPWSYLDRASVFAVVSPALAPAALDACITAAYAEAMLLSADPAEARTWRRATAAWLAWELTGHFGCEDPILKQQAEPFRSWVAGAAGDGAGGALWLAFVSSRHGGASGSFVRDLWSLSSQRTWEGEGLRADPDLWSALDTAVAVSGDRLVDNVEALAVLRWFVGRSDPRNPALRALDSDAQTPATRTMTRLPTRVSASTPLQSFGSGYVVMAAHTWGDATRLHVWLRGEYGVRWSFVAVQLDAQERELQRITAPHTSVTPRAYLPIDIHEDAARLLFVVTNLADGLPDADEPDTKERAFELTVDRAD